MTTTIHIAENDLHGERSGKVTNIAFADADGKMVEFTTFPNMEGVSIDHFSIKGKKEFRIGGKTYQRFGFTAWVGNMIWNSYAATYSTAIQLMRDLYASPDWLIQNDDIGLSIVGDYKASDMGWVTENEETPSEAEPNQLNLFEQ